MKKMYGYTRVSTAKQGEGVSLIEQKSSIEHYAVKLNFEIIEWFEEKETAAKKGRPLFTKMLSLLRNGKAAGMIIHKIDRSARNLRDWADLGELIDSGVEVHFAHEAIDLAGRGGRLSADIQAVIAADYIRNLSEESKKGLYGRLKQGIYPFRAPVGYLDTGSGNLKAIDPVMGPLIKKTFELYSTDRYGYRELLEKMHKMGLRNCNGGKISKDGLTTILHNQFYIGIIHIRVTDQIFEGKHESLISKSLFDKVQIVIKRKTAKSVRKHRFQFRRAIRCSVCGYSLIGEKQKGRVYYRCQTRECPSKCIREDRIEFMFRKILKIIRFKKDELEGIIYNVATISNEAEERRKKELLNLELSQSQVRARIDRLTDKFIDDLIDQETFNSKKKSLLLEMAEIKERLSKISSDSVDRMTKLKNFLELHQNHCTTYKYGLVEEKRDILDMVTSNLLFTGKTIEFSMNSPYKHLYKRSDSPKCAHYRDMARILDRYICRKGQNTKSDVVTFEIKNINPDEQE